VGEKFASSEEIAVSGEAELPRRSALPFQDDLKCFEVF
jgi:hypothetical protein